MSRSSYACTVCARIVVCLALITSAPAEITAARGRYPSLDGSDNNAQHPSWGAADTPMVRYLVNETAYVATNTNTELAGTIRPSARQITLSLMNKPYFKRSGKFNTSYLLSAIGQAISQDIGRVAADPKGANGGELFIAIPRGDPLFASYDAEQNLVENKSRTKITYTRSQFNRTGGPSAPRQQINSVSSFLDASSIYGHKADVLNKLRAGVAGRLRDDGGQLLPFNVNPMNGTAYMKLKNNAGRVPQTQLRLSGNPAVNQNPFLLVMGTLFMREHNRRARLIENEHPDWEEEQLFQEARKWVVAHFQQTALNDYMAGVGIPLPPYTAYNASLNPAVDNFFTTVAYRYGHATINDVILRLDDNWREHELGHLPLMTATYNPNVVLAGGIEPLIRGLVALPQAQVEPRWSTSVSGNLWHPGTINGSDLAAINIMRGRDHGIPDYNTCRRLMGLKPYTTFSDITPDPEIAQILQDLYASVGNMDAYVGGLAEPHHLKGHVGELFYKSIQDQFYRLREGDWWYYENAANGLFNDSEIHEIRNTGLRDIILRNTNITYLPKDIWVTTGAAPGACDAAAALGSSTSQQRQVSLLQGQAQLQLTTVGATEGWLRVTLTAVGQGWLGCGVARPDVPFPMIGADMVIATMVKGVPTVKRYAVPMKDRSPPVEVPEAGRIKNVRFTQSGGQVTLEFERPLAAGVGDSSNAVPADSEVTFIMARGADSEFRSDMNYYHGRDNRDYVTLPKLFSGVPVSLPSSGAVFESISDAIRKRKAHGVLMGFNFLVVLPLGALAARHLRCHFLKKRAIRASLFYVHIATQVTGIAMITAGFVIAVRTFGIKLNQVAYSHGNLGVATLVLIYSQLLMGFARPAATASPGRRKAWDVAHSSLGTTALLLGAVNVAIGVIIFHNFYGANLSVWGGLFVACIAVLVILQHIIDRQEKYAVLEMEQHLPHLDEDSVKAAKPAGEAGPSSKPLRSFVGKLTESMLRRHNADRTTTAAAAIPEGADLAWRDSSPVLDVEN